MTESLIDVVARLNQRNEIKPHVSMLLAYDEPKLLLDALGEIDMLHGQIGALKAALIKDRFWLIWKGGECASVERATAKAEHQLAQEYPDIFGDENKRGRRHEDPHPGLR